MCHPHDVLQKLKVQAHSHPSRCSTQVLVGLNAPGAEVPTRFATAQHPSAPRFPREMGPSKRRPGGEWDGVWSPLP